MDPNLPARPYWLDGAPPPDFPALAQDVYVDVAVVGAGMVGLTCAYLLKRAGYTVAVLEAGRVAALTSGANTGKLSVQHGLVYSALEASRGRGAARLYAQANQEALALIERVLREEGIDCDFAWAPAWLCSPEGRRAQDLAAECEAARRAGVDAELAEHPDLPVAQRAALRVAQQAQFHPRKYLLGLAQRIPGDGSHVFEHSRVLDVEAGTPGRLTLAGASVTAGEIVLATQLPPGERGGLFLKAYPRRHLALAARLAPGAVPELGMVLSVESPGWSLRVHRGPDAAYLIAIGESFKTGHGEPRVRLERLAQFVRSHYPGAAITHWWGAQDYVSADGVPYVGALHGSGHCYAASGFGGWGLTGGTAAAALIAEAVAGRSVPWADLFDATRLNPRVAGRELLKENLDATREWLGGRLTRPPPRTPDDLAPGAGALMTLEGERRAVYRDPDGGLHVLSPVCPHLGCHVSWNGLERSWDCPCHGSRFDACGTLLQGPAVKDLRRYVPGSTR